MKSIWYKKWMRIISGLLCILAFNMAVLAFAGIIACESMGINNREMDAVLNEVYYQLCRDYSIQAMADYQDDFNMEKLGQTRFRYGIIQGDNFFDIDFTNLDLNDRSIYTIHNFDSDKVIDRKDIDETLTLYSCTLGSNTRIHVEDPWTGYSYVTTDWVETYDEVVEEQEYVVQSVYYTSDTRHFYYLVYTDEGEELIYPVKNEVGWDDDYRQSVESFLEATIEERASDAGVSFEWTEGDVRMVIEDGVIRYLADIEIIEYPRLVELGQMMPADGTEGNVNYEYRDGLIHTWATETREEDTTSYYVISYVADMDGSDGWYYHVTDSPFTLIDDWDTTDDFSKAESLVTIAYRFRYSVYGIFLAMLAVTLVTLCICIRGAGHGKGDGQVMSGLLEKIPFDVFILLVLVAEGLLGAFIAAMWFEYNGLSAGFRIFMGIPSILAVEIIAFIFIMDYAVRLKTKTCLKNTLCCRFLLCLKKWLCRGLGGLGQGMEAFRQALPLLLKAWIVMGVLAVVEFLVLVASVYNGGVLLLFILEKTVVYFFLTVALIQMQKLQQAAVRIAAGDMNHVIDTGKMLWDFRKHGENLNKIRDGINSAVEQRMKSEHFKTELITNVSHDIKTPLTSIINYVDLLEKEEIQSEKVQEYLEVLSRQSARLKKLIEDLMEASKASTGNLSVALESCNARILITQTIGEFQEKLSDNHIELIVQGSEEDIPIAVDTRHLCRVFENLMNNICKYALESTRAYVNVERQGRECVMIFRNISKYPLNIDSEELMERFVRGDSSRNTEGSGLGLSIAKSLTELMGGNFELVVDGDLFKVILRFPVIEKKSEYTTL